MRFYKKNITVLKDLSVKNLAGRVFEKNLENSSDKVKIKKTAKAECTKKVHEHFAVLKFLY